MSTTGSERSQARRWPLVAAAALGLGLIAAPAIFQMFDRAPGGGDMIADFEPYMRTEKIDDFRGDLSEIDAAHGQAETALADLPAAQRGNLPFTDEFVEQWPAIDDDMRSMLTTMEENIGNYEGVAALPPFWMFPWFFVIPGVLIAGVAIWTLAADRGRRPQRGRLIALGALAVGLIAAPAVFGMFTRAPGGAAMIDDFKPFMTTEKVTEIQGYFLTIGGGEAEMRRVMIPAVAEARGVAADQILPAVHELNRDWPEISGEMAPMVGTMADNVGNFGGVAALPPFWLFPAFFVLPGLILGALAWRARRTEVAPTALPSWVSAPALPAWASQLSRRDTGRAAAGIVSVVALSALAVMIIESDGTELTTTRRLLASPTPTAAPPAPAAPVASPASPNPTVTRVAGGGATRPESPPPPSEPEPSPQPPPQEPPPPPGAELSCPLPLEPAPAGGGVASFTPIVPLFGPFSPEAFTMLPAFEPFFPLFGPMLVASESFWEAADPALSQVIPPVSELEHAGFDALAPHYEPHRGDVLAGEAELAAQMAAVGEQLVSTPGAGCIPALQALLLSSFGAG